MGNFDFESGKRFMKEGELDEGIRCFLASLDLDPANVDAYIELFKAYELAWQETGDPMVLEQMRKVAVAGLKRGPGDDQRAFLEEGLDRADAGLLAVREAEQAAEREAAAHGVLYEIKPAKDPDRN